MEAADRELGSALASQRDHPAVRCLAKAGELGDQGPLYTAALCIAAFGLIRRDPHCVKAGLSMGGAVGLADLMKSFIKDRVTRSRPDRALEKDEYEFAEGGSDNKEKQSFPSGHTACAVAAVGAISRSYPRAAPYLAGAALVASTSRVLKGRHWPMDLVAGAAIGWGAHRMVAMLTPTRTR